ncbi:MAG: hypothetical protein IKN89_12255 [Oscillospiraceae bacterium]|nr:hypothetical protein [Oscillospiraceae bacterium]MBR3556676.1 hypothetical protein [Oscillospiraceae bacterium]
MTEGLESWVRALAAAGLFTGAVLTLAPGGRSGKVLRLVCGLLLLAVLLSPLGRLDYDAYAEELSRRRLQGLDLSAKGETEALHLLGSVIRKRTEAYILDQAASLGIRAQEVSVTLAAGEEVPYPWSAEVWLEGDADGKQALGAILEGELGIPPRRQIWHVDHRDEN